MSTSGRSIGFCLPAYKLCRSVADLMADGRSAKSSGSGGKLGQRKQMKRLTTSDTVQHMENSTSSVRVIFGSTLTGQGTADKKS
ncbi:hypothetical protein N7478_011732 [Penicillium angulare]|uniref:uncharacterized protein n=1 Tax=Penicillium angulare TaxID=116970 RepID=UPI0025411A8B|nr:uncharacterized protein N7478_011732 [Penicillium angulare]KAJ5261137.1 hypothetical protein N7478_011732 [Penicillium angulare]